MTARSGRRAVRSELITILWRDIPAQVTGRSGAQKVAIELSSRFQVAIDRAAAVADKVKYDEYIGEWRRQSVPCEGDVEAEAAAAAARIEEEFTRERIARLVANGGYAGDSETDEIINAESGTGND